MTTKHIILLTLATFSFSCSKKPENAKKRFLDCYVRYLQQEGETRAEATFRQSENDAPPLPVEIPGGVTYNTMDMKIVQNTGLTYKLTRDGGGPLEHRFEWKNEKKFPQVFNLPMAQVTDFQFVESPISLNKPNRFTWKGEPMGENEKLIFIWENAQAGTVTMEVAGAAPLPSVDFPAAEISKLKPGEWSLYVVRKKVTRGVVIDGVQAGGLAEFYSETKNFVVKP